MWWALQRVKDADDFQRRINAPLTGQGPSPEQVAAEVEDFTAFASMFGVAKPDPADAEA